MKKEKSQESDPIKDKYNQKIGFFKKNLINFNIFKEKIKTNKNLIKEIDTAFSMLGTILLYGVIGGFASAIFGVHTSIVNMLSIGCFLWLIENKLIGFIVRILGSIKIININS